MMSLPIHPLTLLFYGLALVAITALIGLLRWSRHRQSAAYALAGLTLLSCVNVMSYLGGFSIGPLLILVSAPVAVVLALTVHTHRRPVRLLAVTTLLMALGMWTAAFDVVQQFLTLGLALGVLVSMLQLGRTWRVRGTGSFTGWGITLCACVGGLSLLVGSSSGGLWSVVPLVAAGLGVGLALLSSRHRVALLMVAAANLLMGAGFLFP